MKSRNRMCDEKEMEDKNSQCILQNKKKVSSAICTILVFISHLYCLSHGKINVIIELAFRIDLQNALANHRPMQSF